MPSKVEDLSVLVVESHDTMRNQLRGILAQSGITRMSAASSAAMAVRRLRETRFDIILCEYHLGEGQNGQHFLEDIRLHQLIPLSTIFIMVTGERSYERVMGAAELAPNDYLLKPFAAENLRERLERALNKREAFLPVYKLIEAGNTARAASECEACEAKYAAYAIDFLRLRAQLLIGLGRPEEALALYQQILARRSVPWAKLGLAKTHFMIGELEQARDELTELITQNAQFVDAYDWLAKTQEALGSIEEAHEALAKAATLSPHALQRQRRIGEIELDLGQNEAAEKRLATVLRQSKYSDFRDPEDHVRLVKAQLGSGSAERARETLRDLERSMKGQPKADLCQAVCAAMVFTREGDTRQARAAAERAAALMGPETKPSLQLKKEITQVCLEQGLESEAAEVAMDIMRNSADEREVDAVRGMLTRMGRAELGEALASRLRSDVRDTMSEGAALARSGDHAGSVRHFMDAVQKMPGNALVLYNASLALLKYVEHSGWRDDYAEEARNLIERLHVQDPGNAKLGALYTYYEGLQQMHQTAAKRA
ncbi:response regulator [Niveibacterium terrae]|uniref:response regulator n=1 Tax=Niveibacterium terrae TaxID=3373598 RepID=UPI003A9157CF